MAKPSHPLSWIPDISGQEGPLYLTIADAIAADIAASRLQTGTRLPPQRALADRLGIDFTTVTRAYAEAGKRGLVEGRVGQGTFVSEKRRRAHQEDAPQSIDVSMNTPPPFSERGLERRMEAGIAQIAAGGPDLFRTYRDPAGSVPDRQAGAAWLAPRLPEVAPDRVVVCPGGQGALTVALSLLAERGDTICVEALTYPGLLALAAHLGIRVLPVEMDEEGLKPDSFEAICSRQKPKLLYCTPTLHNPTTATIPLARRERIAAIARQHKVRIVEDDAYGALPRRPVAPLAALAPELTYYIGGLAKCLSPALRIAYLVLPDGRIAARAANAVRAFSGMASPITASIATRWIEDGTADRILTAIRTETANRLQAVARILPSAMVKPDCFHAWLELPTEWTASALAYRARSEGVGLVTADAFTQAAAPEAVRIGLGSPRTLDDLARGLEIIADLLERPPSSSSNIV